MKNKIQIREGNTGILYFQLGTGTEERFTPDCDLRESNRLLMEFYELRTNAGKAIKDSFWDAGINWFPTIIALLHWHILYVYVKYKNFFVSYPLDEYEYIFLNKGRLSKFCGMLSEYEERQNPSNFIQSFYRSVHRIKGLLRCLVAHIHNRRVFRHYRETSVLFYRCGVTDDFRTEYLIKTLNDMNIRFIELSGIRLKRLLGSFFSLKPHPNLLIPERFPTVDYKSFLIPTGLDPMLIRTIRLATQQIQDRIAAFQTSYEILKREFRKAPFEKLYGIDDTNSVYPIIYACQANGIETVGHQHGANYSPWDAPYRLNGFSPGEYQWFDKVLVWGKWWREHILSSTICFSEKQIAVATHMRPLMDGRKDIGPKRPKRNILIPYECLADTYTVGRYICALQELDYIIYFKWRPDEELSDELDAYCLPEMNRRMLNIVETVTDELLSKIDIIAGTYSTLIFELMPYLKETWIFETKFLFWDTLLKEGIANRIRLNHLKKDIRSSRNRLNDEIVSKFFSSEPLRKVLARELAQPNRGRRFSNNK